MKTKNEIISDYEALWQQVASIVSPLSVEQFTTKPNAETWSIAQEFDHVIKVASAVSSALKISPFILKWKFGKPNRSIRSYEQMHTKFTSALASVGGKAKAPATFKSEEDKLFNKEEMLKHWSSTLAKFDQRINKWSDKNLDKVLLPHPMLGKMMVREMLYFTHIHTRHHLVSLKRKVAEIS
jgi:uncharacterized damage-inducible protein DinB